MVAACKQYNRCAVKMLKRGEPREAANRRRFLVAGLKRGLRAKTSESPSGVAAFIRLAASNTQRTMVPEWATLTSLTVVAGWGSCTNLPQLPGEPVNLDLPIQTVDSRFTGQFGKSGCMHCAESVTVRFAECDDEARFYGRARPRRWMGGGRANAHQAINSARRLDCAFSRWRCNQDAAICPADGAGTGGATGSRSARITARRPLRWPRSGSTMTIRE